MRTAVYLRLRRGNFCAMSSRVGRSRDGRNRSEPVAATGKLDVDRCFVRRSSAMRAIRPRQANHMAAKMGMRATDATSDQVPIG